MYPVLFFLIFSYIHCFSAALPEGAPLSKKEWVLCERFIQQKSEHLFSTDDVIFIEEGEEIPCSIEKDPITGFIYIHLKNKKEGFIGRGSHKVVTKSILYGKKPLLVAHCEIDQAGGYELEILERMKNQRGVIQYFSYIPHSERYCELFLEYFNCGSFDEIVKGKLHIRDSEVLKVMKDLIIGLKGMHDRGYIHRDIKRENIFFHREGGQVRAVLGDVGLALKIDKDLDRRIAIPDPNCAPEVLLKPNVEIDRRKAETYSLASIFYLMLVERPTAWRHLIPQGKLATAQPEEKMRRYKRLVSMYKESRINDLMKLHGIRKDAAEIVFKMLNPVPEQRISLESALQEVEWLMRKSQ